MRAAALIFVFLLLPACCAVWPQIDLTVSGWFYTPGQGFLFAHASAPLFMRDLAFYGARVLALALASMTVAAAALKKPLLGIAAKGWLFLLLGLLLGPGLVANVALKDHWGRARPREIVEFGGAAEFSPALAPQAFPRKNGSFVSGDAAFGFYLTGFAYAARRRAAKKSSRDLSPRFFWGGIAAGLLFGFSRLAMGAHFLSDVLCAGLLMLASLAALHAVMFGRRETVTAWRFWLFDPR